MITIRLADAGKRFNREWIFRRLSYAFEQGQSYAIIGANGSGKSTLLQVIAGAMNPSEGACSFDNSGNNIDGENIYQNICQYTEINLIKSLKCQELHFISFTPDLI